MKRRHGAYQFESEYAVDLLGGWSGYDLHRAGNGSRIRVARIAFWDASGEFVVETFDGDVPLVILEELIVEAKETIRTR